MDFESLYKLGTDVAGFMFFDHAQLKHRQDDPCNWWDDDPAKEFEEGSLIAFHTGSDGTFTLKFVQRPLSSIEEKALVSSASFRYHVRNGRLFWDNGNYLPSEDQIDEADEDPDGWLTIANGYYRVTVYALDWFSIDDQEREAAGEISHYVVRFETVKSLEEIPPVKEAPRLLASKELHQEYISQHA